MTVCADGVCRRCVQTVCADGVCRRCVQTVRADGVCRRCVQTVCADARAGAHCMCLYVDVINKPILTKDLRHLFTKVTAIGRHSPL